MEQAHALCAEQQGFHRGVGTWMNVSRKSSVPDEGGCSVLPVKHRVGPVYVRHASADRTRVTRNNTLGEIKGHFATLRGASDRLAQARWLDTEVSTARTANSIETSVGHIEQRCMFAACVCAGRSIHARQTARLTRTQRSAHTRSAHGSS